MKTTPTLHAGERVSVPSLGRPTALIDARHPARSLTRVVAWIVIVTLTAMLAGTAVRGCAQQADRPTIAEIASTPTKPEPVTAPAASAPDPVVIRPPSTRATKPGKPPTKRPAPRSTASSRPSVHAPRSSTSQPLPTAPRPSSTRPSTGKPVASQPPVVLEVPDPPKPTTPAPPTTGAGTQDGSGSATPAPPAASGGAGGSNAHNCDLNNESC